MTNWKSVLGSILAFLAISTIVGSALDDPRMEPRSTDQVVFAIGTFLSVLVLQWLTWRFIVPAAPGLPKDITALFTPRSPRGFFSGTVAFGYVQIAIYSLELSGYLQRADPRGRLSFLIIGCGLIALGTVARLRVAFLALAALNEERRTADGAQG